MIINMRIETAVIVLSYHITLWYLDRIVDDSFEPLYLELYVVLYLKSLYTYARPLIMYYVKLLEVMDLWFGFMCFLALLCSVLVLLLFLIIFKFNLNVKLILVF